jgi:hypothetical protein
MDQRRGLQGVSLAFAPQVCSDKLAKLRIHERNELHLRSLVTTPLREESRYCVGNRSSICLDTGRPVPERDFMFLRLE